VAVPFKTTDRPFCRLAKKAPKVFCALFAAATAAFAHAHISSSEHAQIIGLEYSFSTQAELSFGVQGAKSMFSDFGCHFPGIFN
jgi:hypothetical protein